ncbi:hypothetical protein FQA39_LY13459 [Lamprigera yunnana]|nr:hypothetical protein FQA39_LY13459 [Lamprigera yunnana]
MMLINIPWWMEILLVLLIECSNAQEDSLQSALNAVDKRQRGLGSGYKHISAQGGFEKYYLPEDKNEYAFLKPEEHYDVSNYLKDGDFNNQNDFKKHFSSSFRERMDTDNNKERELNEMLMSRLENSRYENDNDDYLDTIRRLSEKYNGKQFDLEQLRELRENEINKRFSPSEYYSSIGSLGYNSVGLKKKSRYFDPDGPSESLHLLNYAPRDELFERMQDDYEDSNLSENYKWNPRLRNDKISKSHFEGFSMKKRFPVTKRSNFPVHQDEWTDSKKSLNRGPRNLAPTDPKVAKDLSNVFGATKSIPTIQNKKDDKISKSKEINYNIREKQSNDTKVMNEKNDKQDKNKEFVPSAAKNEPLQIKKKSIDWSDYFGYDRKKKSGDDIDNEWLMERYHKAIAMATKRNADYSMQHFHNRNEINSQTHSKKSDVNDEEAKLVEMDLKLKNIEDSIVDEALKYTGAHEGSIDPKEVQDIKDKVISRLAAAYSLEKMRQALGEYKMSIAKQFQDKKEEDSVYKQKRGSVPRKQAVDEDRFKTEGDNSIKCSHGEEDCNEQTYKPSMDVVEDQTHWMRGECPQIQRACNEVAEVLGHYGHILESACNIHQICLSCGDNSWFAPTRQCNVLYLAKAEELCDGDIECSKTANRSVRYLLDIFRSLRAEHTQDCDLQCPDNNR